METNNTPKRRGRPPKSANVDKTVGQASGMSLLQMALAKVQEGSEPAKEVTKVKKAESASERHSRQVEEQEEKIRAKAAQKAAEAAAKELREKEREQRLREQVQVVAGPTAEAREAARGSEAPLALPNDRSAAILKRQENIRKRWEAGQKDALRSLGNMYLDPYSKISIAACIIMSRNFYSDELYAAAVRDAVKMFGGSAWDPEEN